MKRIFSIILYILAGLFILAGICMIGYNLLISFLIGKNYTLAILNDMRSQTPLPIFSAFGVYSLLISGILFILFGVLIILAVNKVWKVLIIGAVIFTLLIIISLFLFKSAPQISSFKAGFLDCNEIIPDLAYSMDKGNTKIEYSMLLDWDSSWVLQRSIYHGSSPYCYIGQTFINSSLEQERNTAKLQNPDYFYCTRVIIRNTDSNGKPTNEVLLVKFVLNPINKTPVYLNQLHTLSLTEVTYQILNKSCSVYDRDEIDFVDWEYDSLALGKSKYMKYNT